MGINVEQKAKDVLTVVHDILPQIALSDLAPEDIDKFTGMKNELVELVAALQLDEERLKRVVGSCREDAISTFNAVRQLTHTAAVTGLTDVVMAEAVLAVEAFVERGRDYLLSKERLNTLGNEARS